MNEESISLRLKERFPQCQVAVIDQTGTSNHFEVRISEAELNEMTRVKSHQLIMGLFNDELKSGEIHALSIKILKL